MAWRGKRRAGSKIHRERHIAHANASDRAADRRLDLVHKTTGATVQAGSDEGGVFEGNFAELRGHASADDAISRHPPWQRSVKIGELDGRCTMQQLA